MHYNSENSPRVSPVTDSVVWLQEALLLAGMQQTSALLNEICNKVEHHTLPTHLECRPSLTA
jgi:hypothetical protein